VARTGRASHHQNAHREKTRENLANDLNDRANFARDAFDKILPDKENWLDRSLLAGIIFEQEIMMFEIVLQQCVFDDFVVTMIFAFVLERPIPRRRISQFVTRNKLHYALEKLDCITVPH
jgi:hypothetical protein